MNINDANSAHAMNDIDLSYCRAAIYSALSLGFQTPTDETLPRLLTPDSKACLASAAATLYGDCAQEIIDAIAALPNWLNDAAANLASQHRALFGHSARGAISPYETEYGNEALFQQPQELADLLGFYRAFGLAVRQESHERPDHISCEFEFMMFLALKEAYALEHDDPEMVSETRKAEKIFLRDRLGRFLPAFVVQLRREDPGGFYGRLGAFCRCFAGAEAKRLQITLGAANLGLRPADDNRVPMACGNGTECAAMPGACPPEEADSV